MSKNEVEHINQKQAFTLINTLVVGVMLTCFAFILGKFIQALYPGWQTTALPALAFFVTLETLIIRHIQHTSVGSFQNPILTTLVEITIITLIIKLISMLGLGLSTIWSEITSWQRHFFQNFFDVDFLLLLFAVLLIWLIAAIFSQYLTQLEEDENLMEQEKLGYTFNDRPEARRRLIGLVFLIGLGMLGLMVLINSNWDILAMSPAPTGIMVTVLLIYFFSAFVFMALNQYAIMKARWYFNGLSVQPNLANRWLLYTFVFILLVTLLIMFLPTNFSIGFYPLAQMIFEVAIFIFGIIQFVFTLPIAFVLSLFSSLLATDSINENFKQTIPEFLPPPPQIVDALPWWEVTKSVLFWIIFIGIIIFSIRYYLLNRQSLKSFLSKIKFFQWLREARRWIKTGFNKLNHATAETFQKGIQNIQTFFKNRMIKLPSLAELARKLPPRQAVILTYIDWVQWSKTQGLRRKIHQTPIEFAQIYRESFPDAKKEIDSITHTFILARYSRQPINKEQAQAIRKSLSIIKDIFRMSLTSKEIEK